MTELSYFEKQSSWTVPPWELQLVGASTKRRQAQDRERREHISTKHKVLEEENEENRRNTRQADLEMVERAVKKHEKAVPQSKPASVTTSPKMLQCWIRTCEGRKGEVQRVLEVQH